MWPMMVMAGLGMWAMGAPAVLGFDGPAAVNARVVGPVIAALGIISASEVLRAMKWLCGPLGLWLAVSPWVLSYSGPAAMNAIGVGVLVVLLAPTGGYRRHRYGGGWRVLWERRGTRGKAGS